ncbi:hypothetical protein DIPPA_10726 [Diplonema papillatum]|nr:hypothetical protein DIPPA_10726 [Diplonema papillatum]
MRSRKTPWGSGTKQEAWEWRNPAKLVPAQSVKNTNVHVASRDEKIWERLTKEGDIIHRRHEASRAAAKERPPQDPAKKQRSYQKCYDLVGSTFGSKDARTEKQQKTSVQASASPVRARAEERLKNNSKEAAWQRLYAENTKRINKRTLAITEQKPAPKFQHKPIRKAGIKPTDTGYNNSLYITRKGWLRADSKDRRPSQDLVQDDPLGGLGVGGDPKGIPRVTSINVPSSSNKKPGAGFGGGAKKARSAQPAEARAARQHFAPTASAYAGVEEPFQTMPMEVLDEEDHIVRHLPNDDVVSMSHHEVTVLRSTGELMSMSRQVSEEVIIVHPEMPLGTDVEMHLLDSTNIHASARKHYASQDGEEEEEAGELCRQKLNQERDGRQDGDDEEDTAFRATMRVGEKSGEQSQQEEEQEQEEEFGELGPQEQNPEWEDGRRDREDGEEEAAFRATLRVAEKSGEPTALNNHSTAPGVRGVSGKTKEEIESERFYRAEIERLAREEEDRERAERDRRAVAVRERVEFIEKMQQEQQQEKQQQQQQEKQKQKQGGYSGSADAQPQPRGAQAAPQAAAPSASAAAAAAAAAAVQRQTSSTRYQPPAPQKMQPLGSKMSPMQRAAALRRQAPVNPHADDSNSEEDIAG